jgi:hypothetical protein
MGYHLAAVTYQLILLRMNLRRQTIRKKTIGQR